MIFEFENWSNNPFVKEEEKVREENDNNIINLMLGWEMGELDEFETCDLFQHLVNTGQAWTLQGSYGRKAQELLDTGLIQPGFLGEEI